MNWIDFSKERPKEEPKRKILVYFQADGAFITDTFDANLTHNATHWAEIEPPLPPLSPVAVAFNKALDGPTPDPFEEWFRTVGVFIFDNPNGKYALARAAYDKGWDAALRWKEGQK